MMETIKWSSWVVAIGAQQIQDGGRPPFWKITKIAVSPQQFDRSLRNLLRWCRIGLLTAPTLKKLNFKNPRWRTAAILKTVASSYLCNLLIEPCANPCAKDCFQVLCSPQAATFNSSFSASDYVPDHYSLSGTVEVGLLKCLLAGLPVYLSRRLQSVMNTAVHSSSMACITQTTSQTHSSPSIGSGLRREYGSRRPCSCTRPLVELRHHTWVNWFVSPICLVGVPSTPIVCWYCPLNCLPSVAGPSQSLDSPSVTVCWTTWYLPHLCHPSVRIKKHFCSKPGSLTLSLIPVKLFPTSSGSWSDFISWTTLKIHDWLIDWLTCLYRCWKNIIGASCLSFRNYFESILDNWLFSGSKG